MMPGRLPLERSLGAELASVYSDLHIERGVDLRPATRVVALDGTSAVERAKTSSGDWLDCQLVVVAVGVRPRV